MFLTRAVLAALLAVTACLASPATTAAVPASPSPQLFGLSTPTLAAMTATEKRLQTRTDIVSVYASFTSAFPVAAAQAAARRGASLLVAWEPWDPTLGPKEALSDYQLADITSGQHDAYVTEWARQAALSPAPVMVRFAPEMNGNWNPWSMGVNSNPVDGAVFVSAYRHLVGLFRANGATAVQWVWNPNVVYDTNLPYPQGSFPLASLYPGDDVVDWVALDGYNWGGLRPWGWKSFSQVFASSIREVRQLAPGKPLMIAEIGCAPGARKSAWITDAFTRSRALGVDAMVWFEFDKETDWRLTSSRASTSAARAVLRTDL